MDLQRATHSLSVLVAALWVGGAIPTAAVADEYSWQVSGRYQDVDVASNVESSNSMLRATFYLSAVDDGAGPYELAPFLNRSSYVAIGTERSKMREQLIPSLTSDVFAIDGMLPEDVFGIVGSHGGFPGFDALPAESGIDSSEFDVIGRYVWFDSGWFAGAHARRGDADVLPHPTFVQSRVDHESAGLLAGKYFGTSTALELGLETDTLNQELQTTAFTFDPGFGFPEIPGLPGAPGVPDFVSFDLHTGTDTDTQSARLSVRHVGQLAGSTYLLSASVRSSRSETHLVVRMPMDLFAAVHPFDPPDRGFSVTGPGAAPIELFESERERQVSLSGTLFPTPALGVRLSLANADRGAFGSSDRVGLSANWFFVRNAAVAIELTRADSGRRTPAGSSGSSGADSVSVRLLGRF